ncbi:MAG: ABC transporter permease [Acidimicrobiales bacterium]|nr:ABC transporter permease [Acidimicrobiales bacterium]
MPLAFVAMGELVAEKAGTLNISVEGGMLAGAFGAVVGSSVSGSAMIGLLAGIAIGGVVALVQAYLSHALTVNQFVVGLTLNILALGLTTFLFVSMSFNPERFPVWSIPPLAQIPVLGEVLFEQRAPFFAIYLLVPLAWFLIHRTRWGLEAQAVGENPQAADATGISVNLRRRQAIIIGGLYAGFGGAFLSIGAIGGFSPNMTAGRGFIAIAAVIFGAWSIKGALLGCFVFGFMDALRLALPALGIELNPQLLIASPYIMALLALYIFRQRQRQPRMLGIGFERRAV